MSMEGLNRGSQVTARLRRLRDRMRGRSEVNSWGWDWIRWPAMASCAPGACPATRSAKAFSELLELGEPVIYPEELIVGALRLPEPTRRQAAAFKKTQTCSMMLPPQTIDGHYGIDHDLLLREGLEGVRARVEAHLADFDPGVKDGGVRQEYLRAMSDSLDAALDFCDRMADAVDKEAGREAKPRRRAELQEVAEICRRVPRGPAHTFHEALQSVWMVHMLCRWENGQCAGRFDRTFIDFYRRDLAAGRLTEKRARELIGAFLIKYNEFGTWPQGALLGGLDAQGRDITNELTYMFLEAQGELALVNPATCIGWNSQTPPELLEKAVEYLCRGNSLPALMNDEVIVPSLVEAGVSPEEAVNYLNSTCVEITVQGGSGIRVVASYISFPQVLLRTLHNGRDVTEHGCDSVETGAPEELTSFEQFMQALRRQFAWALDENARRTIQGLYGHPFARNYPFSSCFVHDCVERARDWSDGGPRYNFSYPQLVGLPNVVDSLLAIRELVYEKQELSLPAFVAAVEANFEGHEALRQRILNTMPKWGTDDPQADVLAQELVAFYYDHVSHQRSHLPNGQFYPGFLCWVMHARLGVLTPATPDGRLAGIAFADSLAANQGRALSGPTGEIASLNKLNFRGALGGMVYNLMLNRTMYNGAGGRRKLQDLLTTYFRGGGFQAQISVVDGKTLEEARGDPERFADLMVKVGGYSDYFVVLSPELQEALLAKEVTSG